MWDEWITADRIVGRVRRERLHRPAHHRRVVNADWTFTASFHR
jgi:hypothetical protein